MTYRVKGGPVLISTTQKFLCLSVCNAYTNQTVVVKFCIKIRCQRPAYELVSVISYFLIFFLLQDGDRLFQSCGCDCYSKNYRTNYYGLLWIVQYSNLSDKTLYYNESFVNCQLSLEKRSTMVESKDNLSILIFIELRLPVHRVIVGLTRALYRLDHTSLQLLTFQEVCIVVVDSYERLWSVTEFPMIPASGMVTAYVVAVNGSTR